MKIKTLSPAEIASMKKDDLIIEHNGEIYSSFYAEMNSIKDGKQIQCEKCHDTFKAPFQIFFNLQKYEVMVRCPNGCEVIHETKQEVINNDI